MSGKGWGQTASISGNATVCQGATEPIITFTGAEGIPEYTFTYKINEGEPLTITTTVGTSIDTISVPTAAAGTFIYSLVSVTDGNHNTASAIGSVTVIVNPLPATISGISNLCAGSITTLSSETAGGTWSSSNLPVATVNSGTGEVSGVSSGIAIITYTLGTGCSVNSSVTVNPLPTTSAIHHQ